jgi:hypothetical protein
VATKRTPIRHLHSIPSWWIRYSASASLPTVCQPPSTKCFIIIIIFIAIIFFIILIILFVHWSESVKYWFWWNFIW